MSLDLIMMTIEKSCVCFWRGGSLEDCSTDRSTSAESFRGLSIERPLRSWFHLIQNGGHTLNGWWSYTTSLQMEGDQDGGWQRDNEAKDPNKNFDGYGHSDQFSDLGGGMDDEVAIMKQYWFVRWHHQYSIRPMHENCVGKVHNYRGSPDRFWIRL